MISIIVFLLPNKNLYVDQYFYFSKKDKIVSYTHNNDTMEQLCIKMNHNPNYLMKTMSQYYECNIEELNKLISFENNKYLCPILNAILIKTNLK